MNINNLTLSPLPLVQRDTPTGCAIYAYFLPRQPDPRRSCCNGP